VPTLVSIARERSIAMLRSHLPVATVVVTIAVLAGTGTTAASAGGSRPLVIKPPGNIAKAHEILFCSDVTYPPEEFYRGSTPAGSDIDIGSAAARLMGVKARFANTGFDGIIPALLSHKCDAIISGMNDTPTRRKQVSFVDYLRVGQSLMVQKGNPKHVSSLASLSGLRVSVEVGTTNAGFLQSESKKLEAAGKKAISIVTFPKDTDAANALKTGKVDAYFGDAPVVAYYIKRDSSFAFAGQPINPIPVGIALRKDEGRLRGDLQRAIRTMYGNGAMRRILNRWNMASFALKR
jgi:polar amino acid transport system substrate-binding protein